jgi:hypothetical protein
VVFMSVHTINLVPINSGSGRAIKRASILNISTHSQGRCTALPHRYPVLSVIASRSRKSH